jgi:glycosyltransferase involved in cell wall biosynthesis
MHILFVHQNFPAQFGHIASYLVRTGRYKCSFVSRTAPGVVGGVRKIQYDVKGGATRGNHYFSRTFENTVWHAWGVFEACRANRDLKPDLIVGHSGFGSTLYLNELYRKTPIINYFEYYYHTHGTDLDFRREFPSRPVDMLRAKTRNAMILLDLQNCRAGYSPTQWQRSLFPAEYQPKIECIFDGIDTTLFQRRLGVERKIGDRVIPPGTRIVTYVSRGFESMRGFDIFMRVAKQIYKANPNVVFVCVGSDRTCYGNDLRFIKTKTFKEHVLAQDEYDLSKFIFTGLVPPRTLVDILSMGDLHIYLTVPFVLSWSLVNSLSCGCTVLASDTPPVREFITNGRNGFLEGFYEVDRLAERALQVLEAPEQYRPLGEAGANLVRQRYDLRKTLPRLLKLFEQAKE